MTEDFFINGLALLFTFIGTYWLLGNKRKLREWKKTDATVIDHVWRTSTDRDDDGYESTTELASEIFSFVVNGKKIEVEGNLRSSNPIKINERVEIMYNPLKSSEIMVLTTFRIYAFPLLFIVAGVATYFIYIMR